VRCRKDQKFDGESGKWGGNLRVRMKRESFMSEAGRKRVNKNDRREENVHAKAYT